MKYYSTMRAARSALAQDTGFDPFLSGGWGRCTRAKLRQHGYIIDPKQAAAVARGHHCQTCQTCITPEWDGSRMPSGYYYPTHCKKCRLYNYACDNGHKWTATEAEDHAAGNRCPTCGEYWQ